MSLRPALHIPTKQELHVGHVRQLILAARKAWQVTETTERLKSILTLTKEQAQLGALGESSKRPRRGVAQERPVAPSLPPVALDGDERVVYVNLELPDPTATLALDRLRDQLKVIAPSERALERLTPKASKGRLLVEINDIESIALFQKWLMVAAAASGELRQLLTTLGEPALLLGAHWIIPKVTEYEPYIAEQEPHTDVDAKGEVVSIAIHVDGAPMGTLIDPLARIDARDNLVGGAGFKRANASVFAYDTNAVHKGPGVPYVNGPYPKYFTQRVFFMLAPAAMSAERVAHHQRDNGLTVHTARALELVRW